MAMVRDLAGAWTTDSCGHSGQALPFNCFVGSTMRRWVMCRFAALLFLLVFQALSANASPADDLQTYKVLLQRFRSVCFEAFPDPRAFDRAVNALQLFPTHTLRAFLPEVGIMQGWTGDVGAGAPNPSQLLTVLRTDGPTQVCGVTAKVRPLDEISDLFADTVRAFIKHRKNTRLFDVSSLASPARTARFVPVRILELVNGNTRIEEFEAAELKSTRGVLNFVFLRKIAGPAPQAIRTECIDACAKRLKSKSLIASFSLGKDEGVWKNLRPGGAVLAGQGPHSRTSA